MARSVPAGGAPLVFPGIDFGSEGSAYLFQKVAHVQAVLQQSMRELESQLMSHVDSRTESLQQLVAGEREQRLRDMKALCDSVASGDAAQRDLVLQVQELWTELRHSCRQQLAILEQNSKNSEALGACQASAQSVQDQLRRVEAEKQHLDAQMRDMGQQLRDLAALQNQGSLQPQLDRLSDEVGLLTDRIGAATEQARLSRMEADVASLSERMANVGVELLAHRHDVNRSLKDSAKERAEMELSLATLLSAIELSRDEGRISGWADRTERRPAQSPDEAGFRQDVEQVQELVAQHQKVLSKISQVQESLIDSLQPRVKNSGDRGSSSDECLVHA